APHHVAVASAVTRRRGLLHGVRIRSYRDPRIRGRIVFVGAGRPIGAVVPSEQVEVRPEKGRGRIERAGSECRGTPGPRPVRARAVRRRRRRDGETDATGYLATRPRGDEERHTEHGERDEHRPNAWIHPRLPTEERRLVSAKKICPKAGQGNRKNS